MITSRKGLTRPMPKGALKVAEILRRDVVRPRDLPLGNPLRFDKVLISGEMGWPCPMGLHHRATCDEPYSLLFGKDGEAFGSWWDEQRDASAAVEAVWG